MALVFQNTELKMTAGRKDQFPRDALPQIALSGRSNVGKSSLINTVIGRKNYARTSSSPGKTVTINFYLIDKKIYLVDLPGYGFAKRPGGHQREFSKLTEEYITQDGKPDFVFQLVDLKVGPTEDDLMMLDWLNSEGIPYAVVATKADKVNATTRRQNAEALRTHPYLNPPYADGKIPVIEFSALNGDGKKDVISKILEVI